MAAIDSKQKTKGKPPANGFKKGKSGNPGGRPKLTPEAIDLVAACKKKTPEALAVLTNIMEAGENERNRITAALAIIERAWGKAIQPVEAKVDATVVVNIKHF